MIETGPTYTLKAAPPPAGAPALDEHQQAVVDHPGGPLLVLAGPGTGKTTTLVEAIVERIDGRGASPESVLALTFSRKAAEQLRTRVTARLGRTTSAPVAWTFHSFAYALVRQYAPAELYAAPLRLLSAPEQDVVLRELLEDAPEAVQWPDWLRRAAGTRGFAHEVAGVLGRAREKGLDPAALRRIGEQEQLPEIVAAGLFAEQYLTVLDDLGAVDYADLVRRAVIEARVHRAELRERFRHVFVDEYQDTDPGQVALLEALAGDGGNLVVVGDPHQSIYGFRGADVRGILDFPDTFRRGDGQPADVVVLRTARRFGADILAASQAVASRLPLGGSLLRAHREAFAGPLLPDGVGPGRVDVFTCDTDRAELERIADLLRRAHLEDGVPWSQMAVLVRSGRASIGPLRRALTGLGVPIDLAADDTPLVREAAVAPLLSALRAVTCLDVDHPAHPDYLHPDDVAGLLVGPLSGLDAADVRAVAGVLRRRDAEHALAAGRAPAASADLLRAAVVDPAVLSDLDHPAVTRLRRFAEVLAAARLRVDAQATAEEVLWSLWDGSGWAARLRGLVERGGAAGLRAHRDLDAVCALFDAAARAEERRGFAGVRTFLDSLQAQDLPSDTLAETGVRGDGVRLLTAHRSKGLEWDLVVVAHVQEGGWPDLRRRSSLLGADRLGAERYGEPLIVPDVTTRELLAEERRLFYVACTRARRRLVVTAVRSAEEDGEQPSRFLEETGVLVDGEVAHVTGRPERPLTFSGVVAELRRVVADPATPASLRTAAATRLSRLAASQVAGRPVAAAADPSTWWGLRRWTQSGQPLRDEELPLRLSASTVKALDTCPARWFLDKEAGGTSITGQAQALGNIVHALAERVASPDLADATLDELMEHVDTVWHQLAFRTPWSSGRERAVVLDALTRFLHHHRRPDAHAVLGTEIKLDVVVPLPDGTKVQLYGFADRVEINADGDVVVVDLKTGKYPLQGKELATDAQLGLYQHAVNHGALDALGGHSGKAAGAELWQLRTSNVAPGPKIQRQAPQEPDEEGWLPIERQLAATARTIRAEEFPARPGEHCRFCAYKPLCPAQVSGTVLS